MNTAHPGPGGELREALIIAVTALGRVNVRCFDTDKSPLKPIGDIARQGLFEVSRTLGDAAYDEIARASMEQSNAR